ncbi:hypothetical protein Q9189_002361 [Teloschistes chrysophthalmus]
MSANPVPPALDRLLANGAYYEAAYNNMRFRDPFNDRHPRPDPFAVLGLYIDNGDPLFGPPYISDYTAIYIMPYIHIRETTGTAATTGYQVPSLAQVIAARDRLVSCTHAEFLAQRGIWRRRGSQPQWNPLAPVGSPLALVPVRNPDALLATRKSASRAVRRPYS